MSPRHMIRILWLVPIYAVESWLALLYDQTWYGELFQLGRHSSTALPGLTSALRPTLAARLAGMLGHDMT